jgi:hypothetical protein
MFWLPNISPLPHPLHPAILAALYDSGYSPSFFVGVRRLLSVLVGSRRFSFLMFNSHPDQPDDFVRVPGVFIADHSYCGLSVKLPSYLFLRCL